MVKATKTPEEGGHTLQKIERPGVRSRWRCRVCKVKSASRAKLACQACKGDPKVAWARKAAEAKVGEEELQSTKRTRTDVEGHFVARPHDTVWSDETLWCTVCGAYADTKAVGLENECRGRPKRGSNYGGAWGQLRKLMRGKHPRSNAELPPPKRQDGSLWTPGGGKYERLKESENPGAAAGDGFYMYIPDAPKVYTQSTREKSVAQLGTERLDRVRKRQADALALLQVEGREKRYRMRSKGPEARGSADGWV